MNQFNLLAFTQSPTTSMTPMGVHCGSREVFHRKCCAFFESTKVCLPPVRKQFASCTLRWFGLVLVCKRCPAAHQNLFEMACLSCHSTRTVLGRTHGTHQVAYPFDSLCRCSMTSRLCSEDNIVTFISRSKSLQAWSCPGSTDSCSSTGLLNRLRVIMCVRWLLHLLCSPKCTRPCKFPAHGLKVGCKKYAD